MTKNTKLDPLTHILHVGVRVRCTNVDQDVDRHFKPTKNDVGYEGIIVGYNIENGEDDFLMFDDTTIPSGQLLPDDGVITYMVCDRRGRVLELLGDEIEIVRIQPIRKAQVTPCITQNSSTTTFEMR